jgi:hypothetical protein
MDGKHAFPDQDAREGPNRDEPACSRLQHEAGNSDSWRWGADAGHPGLIARISPTVRRNPSDTGQPTSNRNRVFPRPRSNPALTAPASQARRGSRWVTGEASGFSLHGQSRPRAATRRCNDLRKLLIRPPASAARGTMAGLPLLRSQADGALSRETAVATCYLAA